MSGAASGPGSALVSSRRVGRAVIWLPGLAVAVGAAAATAHGLYEVAVAAGVPIGIGWLYPLITDGLALVAYAGTARLVGSPRRYAWAVVAMAAGLSGLAQAVYLAGGATLQAGAALRFGIGAWPAVAAAVVAHLLFLLATDHDPHPAPAADEEERSVDRSMPRRDERPVQLELFNGTAVHRAVNAAATDRDVPVVQPMNTRRPDNTPPAPTSPAVEPLAPRPAGFPARDRAHEVVRRLVAAGGRLPTVTELQTAAGVSRGTAAAVLKALRDRPEPPRPTTDTHNARSQE